MHRMRIALGAGLALAALLTTVTAGASRKDVTLNLVAYSTPKAAYGAERFEGKTDKQAIAYLGSLFKNVAVQDKSARDALQTFLSGKGDVLLTYENEAILAKQKGQPVQYIIPKSTILIENPVAIVAKGSHQTEAKAFLRFLYTPAAQTIFAQTGYRPVVQSVRGRFSFPRRPGIFT